MKYFQSMKGDECFLSKKKEVCSYTKRAKFKFRVFCSFRLAKKLQKTGKRLFNSCSVDSPEHEYILFISI